MNNRQQKMGVIISYASTGLKVVLTLAYMPFLLRLLGQSEYGLYQLVYSTISYLSLLSFGLTSSYIRFFSRERSKRGEEGVAKLNGLFLIVLLIIAVIAVILGTVLAFNVDIIYRKSLSETEISTAHILMLIATANIAMKFPSTVFSCYIAAHERFTFQRGFLLIQSLLEPLLTIPILMIGFKSVGVILVLAFLSALELISYAWYAINRLKMKFVFSKLDFSMLKEIYVFSFFVFLSDVTVQINWSVDKVLLGIFKGTVEVAVYSLASQINTMFCTFGTTISSVFIPRINSYVQEGSRDKEINALFIKVGRIQHYVLMLILTGFVLLGKPFIKFWGGDGYEQSYYVALILLVSAVPSQIQNLGIQIQMAMNKHYFRSICYFAIAICNIIITIPLCQQYGPIGSAIGTAISLIAGSWFSINYYYSKHIGLKIRDFWLQITRISIGIVPAFVIGILMVSIVKPDTFFEIVIIACVYSILYLCFTYALSMNSMERGIVKDALKKGIKIIRK